MNPASNPTADSERPTTSARPSVPKRIMDLESFLAEESGADPPPPPVSGEPPADPPAPKPEAPAGAPRAAATTISMDRRHIRWCAVVVGLGIVAAVVVGLLALAEFWEQRGIRFTTSTTPATTTASTTVTGEEDGVVIDEPTSDAISLEELELHDVPREDCWVVFFGTVYDMTWFPSRHPGGEEFITRYCGKDGTRAFGLYHSEPRLRTIRNEFVGSLLLEENEEVSDVAEGAAISLEDFLGGGRGRD